MSGGADRGAFLDRVRAGLGRTEGAPAPPAPPSIDERVLRQAGPDDDLPARFADRAAAVGLVVHRATDADLAERIADVLRAGDDDAPGVLVCVDDVALAAPLADAVRAAGAVAVPPPVDPGLAAVDGVDVAVTDTAGAIAESGTLVLASSARQHRLAWLAAPVHVAVVRASAIRPDLIDWLAEIDAHDDLPAALLLVTGPSKTADIEGVLVTGVHGPEAVHVVIVDGR